jgi:hypothetical protein
VEGVEVVLAGEFVQFGVVGVVELIPGHDGSYGSFREGYPPIACV